MKYNSLGKTELVVSRICLGTMTFGWTSDERTTRSILDHAYEAGINFLDTADIYSSWAEGHKGGESETIIGRWLKEKPREKVILATKVRGRMWPGDDGEGLSAPHITRAIEGSLRRLQTDYVDLYQTHWPDEHTAQEETAIALDALVRAGKVRFLGCSNYTAQYLQSANELCEQRGLARFDTLQPNYSLLKRKEYEEELAEYCVTENIGVIPYSPLAAGFLTGKYTRKNPQPDSTRQTSKLIQSLKGAEAAHVVLDALREIARECNAPVSQIALAWLLARPQIDSAIIGARTIEQLEQNLGATEVTLSDAALTQLNALSQSF
ncbi:MAG: aldo/keto reductase [Anaerolineaceae bacterium]|nr:aldo/keto reductase [Anaerolineaceae bacterium]